MAVEVVWVPVGAGERVSVVAVSGWLFERAVAALARRRPRRLVHAALVVHLPPPPGPDVSARATWTVEMVPAWAGPPGTAVAVSGPVGIKVLGRSRWFRYEVRVRPGVAIPDVAYAVARTELDEGDERAGLLLACTSDVPELTWGRPVGTAGMWNSNSVVAWLLRVGPRPEGRAAAGRVACARVGGRAGGRCRPRVTAAREGARGLGAPQPRALTSWWGSRQPAGRTATIATSCL